MSDAWSQLEAWATDEITSTLMDLPNQLRDRARALPVSCVPKPNRECVKSGIEEDTLGLFVGESYADGPSGSPLPPHILLFLDNIWEYAEHEEEVFREEVRTTYLHELGHYLGLDEDDLDQRGLL